MMEEYRIAVLCTYKEDLLSERVKALPFRCTSDCADALNGADALLMLDNEREKRTEKYNEMLQSAVRKGIPILITEKTKAGLEQHAYKLFHLLENHFPYKQCFAERGRARFYETAVPVISVVGLGSDCSKFEMQLLLKEHLQKQGYRVLHVSSNSLGTLFGAELYPAWLYSEELSFSEIVANLNRWFHVMTEEKKPDIVVMGIPGGIGEFDVLKKNTSFSAVPLMVTNAIASDASICCIYQQPMVTEEALEEIRLLCQYKFETDVYSFALSRYGIRYYEETESTQFLFLNEETILPDGEKRGHVFRMNNKEEMTNMMEELEEEMESWILRV